jgi:hypothetical protein
VDKKKGLTLRRMNPGHGTGRGLVCACRVCRRAKQQDARAGSTILRDWDAAHRIHAGFREDLWAACRPRAGTCPDGTAPPIDLARKKDGYLITERRPR